MVIKSFKILVIATIFGISGLTGCSDTEDTGFPEEQNEDKDTGKDDDGDEEGEEGEGGEGGDPIPVLNDFEEYKALYNNLEEYMLHNTYVYRVEALEDTVIERLYSSLNNDGAKDRQTNTNWVYGFPSEIAGEENTVTYLHFDRREMDRWQMNGTGSNYTHIDFGYNLHYDRFIMGTDIWAYEMYWGTGSRVIVIKYGEVVAKADFFITDGEWLLDNDYFN